MTKDYYAILGISPDTNQALIKEAAQARANEINEAFRVLGDIEQRKAYDALRLNITETTPPPSPSVVQPHVAAEFSSTDETKPNKRRSSVEFSQKHRSSTGTRKHTIAANLGGGGGLVTGLLTKMKIDPPNSAREVVIFLLAVVFVAYMASGFFADPQDRFGAGLNIERKSISRSY